MNLFQFLFTARADLPNTNFNALPWLVVAVGAILISAYYWVEGRRKLPWIKDHTVWKQWILDRLFGSPQLPIWGLVGLLAIGMQGLDTSFFSWRIWIALWVGWGVAIAIYWLVFFVRSYPGLIVAYERQKERHKYHPSVNRNRRRSLSAR